jgi:hypothetical protein
MQVYAPGVSVDVLDGTPTPPAVTNASGRVTVYAPGLSVNVIDAQAPDHDADWLARSTGPGVVWAHDFRDPNEVRAWRYTPVSAAATIAPDHILDVKRVASSGIGNSGMMVHTIRGTRLAQPLDATATTVYLESVADFPDPALAVGGVHGTGRYSALMGVKHNSEQVYVTGINRSNNSLTITRTADATWRRAHAVGEGFSAQDQTAWWRLMGAFGAWNGKASPDIGIANGFKNFDADWTGQGVGRNYGRFRGAYWGHPQYEALYDATWPVNGYDTASTTAGRVFRDTFVGNEFWIQWRMKITGDRRNNPDGKFCYLQAVSSARHQWFTNIGTSTRTPTRLNFVNDGQSRNINLSATTNNPYSAGTDYQWLFNEWVTYMIRIRPGRKAVRETLADLYVQEPGDTAWRHVCTSSSVDLAFTGPAANHPHPEAYNVFSILNYANHYEGSSTSGASPSTHAVQATQVILSSREIPIPRSLVS